MKKIILLLLVFLPILHSCSNDSAESDPFTNDGTRLKETVLIERSNGYASRILYKAKYFYKGNKLHKIKGGSGSSTLYFYTGNLITKCVGIYETTYYTYNANDKLASVTAEHSNGSHKYTNYTYNADGSISIDYQFLDASNVPRESKRYEIVFENNNKVKVEEYINDSTSPHTSYYTYDSKKAPTNDILGFSKLLVYENGPNSNSGGNNKLTQAGGSSENNIVSRFYYTYNLNGYPKVQIEKFDRNDSTYWETQYTYE